MRSDARILIVEDDDGIGANLQRAFAQPAFADHHLDGTSRGDRCRDRSRQRRGRLRHEVEDEGSGLSGDPEAVFSTVARRGHGFGLPLAAALAHAEGARVRLANCGPHPVFELTLR